MPTSSTAENSPRGPGGRPTKYDPRFCHEVVEFCRKGKSLTAYAAHIGVNRSTITEWGLEHKEFSAAIKSAKAVAEAYLETVGIAGMTGQIKYFNGPVWIFWMKARFGWRDEPINDEFDESSLEFV